MRAVTFQAPGVVSVQERPEPRLREPGDAIVAVDASGICGSDLHILSGRVRIEPGFTLGHEFVGRVTQVADGVTHVRPGDRVLGCFHTACGSCWHCIQAQYHKCERMRVFGHGEALGALQGTQAEAALVPMADMTLRRVPDSLSDEAALFAGDVLATGLHAVSAAAVGLGDTVAVLGLGPVGLCAVQVALAAGARAVLAVDSVPSRLELSSRFGALAVDLNGQDPRERCLELTGGRGADAVIDAVGSQDALELAIRLARKAGTVVAIGVYAERCEVHMGLLWIKALTLHSGQANVIAHVDRAIELLASGRVDPSPLVTHRMALEQAAEAYAIFARREALKIVLTPQRDLV